jgi:hypothetical protein
MIRKVRDWEMVGMVAVTELRDDFGNTHLSQTHMNMPGVSHETKVIADTAMMQSNEDNYVANLLADGWTQAEIDALKK